MKGDEMDKEKKSTFLQMINFGQFRKETWLSFGLCCLFILINLLLPQKSQMTIFSWIVMYASIIVYIAFAGIVIGNPVISNFWKNIVAIGFFAVVGLLFYRYSNAKWGQFKDVFLNFSVMNKTDPMSTGGNISNWNLMFAGLLTTLKIFLLGAGLATVVGLFIAIVRTLINDSVLNAVLVLFVDICRSLPILVVLIIVYSALPYTGIVLSPNASGILTIGFVEGAYLSEIFRAGLNSIHAVQTEAAHALGLSGWQTMRLVILPQAVKVIIPPYTSSLVGIMKGTALCSAVTIYEMVKTAQQIQAWYASPTPIVVATLGYLLLLLPLTSLSSRLEKKFKKT